MYNPSDYRVEDQDQIFEFMNCHSFATLISGGSEGIQASHLPFTAHREPASCGKLVSHMAKENPQWETFGQNKEVLVIFQGPHAYISPSWYKISRTVPTWNYTVVHACGVPRLISDDRERWNVLLDLLQRHEGNRQSGWSLDQVPRDFLESLFAKIVVFEIAISRLEGKFKLSQDKPDEDRANVIRMLKERADPGGKAVAEMMGSLNRV